MSLTAVLSDAPGLRLNDIVAAGNCPRCEMDSGTRVICSLAMALRGTCPPLAVWLGR